MNKVSWITDKEFLLPVWIESLGKNNNPPSPCNVCDSDKFWHNFRYLIPTYIEKRVLTNFEPGRVF